MFNGCIKILYITFSVDLLPLPVAHKKYFDYLTERSTRLSLEEHNNLP
jgi:hypothetical protein